MKIEKKMISSHFFLNPKAVITSGVAFGKVLLTSNSLRNISCNVNYILAVLVSSL